MIALHGVSQRYGAKTVLHDVSLDLAKGELVGVTGPSGSGKSTLLRLIAGIERASSGLVLVEGRPLWSEGGRLTPPRRGWAGMIFQDPAGSLDPAWRLSRILAEPFHARGRATTGADERDEQIRDALHRVGLGGLDLNTRVRHLSGGQQQRVALARMLLSQPDLVLADEPTSALDATNAAGVMHLLLAMARTGATVVVVSHNTPMLRSFAERVLSCSRGTLRPLP